MILEARVDTEVYQLHVPEELIAQGTDFFAQLDRDMAAGWQMSRDWIEQPNPLQRAQIVADKLLTALEKSNHQLGLLMAGYLLARLPGLQAVDFDIQGEMQNHQFHFAQSTPEPESAVIHTAEVVSEAPRGLSKLDALTQAGKDVTAVFKMGKGWRFSVFDHGTQQWRDSPLIATEAEAERLRQQALAARYEALQRV